MLKKLSSIILIVLGIGITVPNTYAMQQVPINYTNSQVGRLYTKIDPDQTTNIKITANTFVTPGGSNVVKWSTGSQILRLSRKIGNQDAIEYIGAESASQVGSLVTLGTATRYLSETDGNNFSSLGNGLGWPNGTVVELVQTVQHVENTMYVRNINVLTGSGKIIKSGSGGALFSVPSFTAAEQANFYTPNEHDFIFDEDSGTYKTWEGGKWNPLAGSGSENAGYGNSGKTQCASPSELAASTGSGSSGAPLVACGQEYTVGTTASGHVVVTNPSGRVAPAIMGSGTPSSSNFLRGDGTWSNQVSVLDKLFGTGSNTTQSFTGSTTLSPSVEYTFTGATIGGTLSVSSVNVPLVLRFNGNVTLNGTINLDGKGGAGGAASAVGGNGNNGTAGTSLLTGYISDYGDGATGGGVDGGAGGGGASYMGAGSIGTGTAPGAGGIAPDVPLQILLANAMKNVVCGGGGGSGSSQSLAAGGAGGAGAGSLVMYISGNLTLGASSVITADGVNGSNASNNAGGGGGGGGGTVFIFVGGKITNGGVTVGATAGSGGTGNKGTGGSGKAGKVLIMSLSTGTIITN